MLAPHVASSKIQATMCKSVLGSCACRKDCKVWTSSPRQWTPPMTAHRISTSRGCMATQEEEFLKRYLEYCRVKCSPRLTSRAASNLAADYVEIRQEVSLMQITKNCISSPTHTCGVLTKGIPREAACLQSPAGYHVSSQDTVTVQQMSHRLLRAVYSMVSSSLLSMNRGPMCKSA